MRRVLLVCLSVALVGSVGCSPAGVLRAESSPVTQVRLGPPLSPNAFIVTGTRGPIVVDPGPPGEGHAQRLDAALADLGFRPQDVALVILTHAHVDHAGGSARLQALGAEVVGGLGDLVAFRSGQGGHLRPTGLEAEFVDAVLIGSGSFPAVDPDIVLGPEQPSLDLSPYGVDGRVIQMPGHTPGSLAVLLASGEAIAGDLVRGGYFGGMLASSRPMTHYFQEDRLQAEGHVAALLRWGARRLYVGHGGPLAADRLADWLDAALDPDPTATR
ncbi:MAG: MBL fold metallo-hydrolase [Bacteroidota bacterium]